MTSVITRINRLWETVSWSVPVGEQVKAKLWHRGNLTLTPHHPLRERAGFFPRKKSGLINFWGIFGKTHLGPKVCINRAFFSEENILNSSLILTTVRRRWWGVTERRTEICQLTEISSENTRDLTWLASWFNDNNNKVTMFSWLLVKIS